MSDIAKYRGNMLAEIGMERTFLIKAKDPNQEVVQKDALNMMKELGVKPFIQKATPRWEKGLFAVTLRPEHKDKLQEVIDKIRKADKVKFIYAPSEGVEDPEDEEDVPPTKPTQRENGDSTKPKYQSPLTTFIRTRTIQVKRINLETKPEKTHQIELLYQLRDLKWKQHVTRVTPNSDEPGGLIVTFKSTQAKDIVEKIWNQKVLEGKLKYKLMEEDTDSEYIMKLDRLPEEVPTKAMEAYLTKYVINPKMEITVQDLSEYGLGTIEIGEATVTHEGLRRLIPRYVWVGPGVTARVTSLAKKPWDSYKVICSLCKGEGHKAWLCPKQTSCSRCKATTHKTVDCQQCRKCKKYGHAGECTAEEKSDNETRKENTDNAQEVIGEKEQVNQQESHQVSQQDRPPKQTESPKQPTQAPKPKKSTTKGKKAKPKKKNTEEQMINYLSASNTVGVVVTGTDVEDDDSEIEFMDNDEFHAALGTKRKFPDTDSDASTIAKKERSNGKGKGAS